MGATFADASIAAPDEAITSVNCNEDDIDLERAEREIIAHLKHEKERRAQWWISMTWFMSGLS